MQSQRVFRPNGLVSGYQLSDSRMRGVVRHRATCRMMYIFSFHNSQRKQQVVQLCKRNTVKKDKEKATSWADPKLLKWHTVKNISLSMGHRKCLVSKSR